MTPPKPSWLVLIVEDTPTNMLMLRTILVRAGHRVVEATTAEQARQQLQLVKPDLILMDVQLPGQDGLSLTRELKADPRTAPIPIVAVTAHAMKGDEEQALAAGCAGYISKPVNTRSLPQQLAAVLAQNR
jgi:two-component system cell cycle response regulator